MAWVVNATQDSGKRKEAAYGPFTDEAMAERFAKTVLDFHIFDESVEWEVCELTHPCEALQAVVDFIKDANLVESQDLIAVTLRKFGLIGDYFGQKADRLIIFDPITRTNTEINAIQATERIVAQIESWAFSMRGD